jgi:DNA-binding MarR family transcriptional regulator
MVIRTSAAQEAWRSCHELVFSEQGRARMHAVCESLDLTPGLMKALLSIPPGQSRPMKELAGEWHCDASYVTSLVDGLEERGVVERRAHPTDRRAKVIVLTEDGARMRDEVLDRIHEPPPWFDVLSQDEAETLRDLLAKLVAAAAARV